MTAEEVRAKNRRLDTELLAEAQSVDPGSLHWAPEGEWSLAQVLAHLGEFPRFFAEELRRWREDPTAVIGRTHEHPSRLAAVTDPVGQRDELMASARSAFGLLGEMLDGLSDADLEAPTENVKYGREPLTAFLDRYVLSHKEGHLEQIRALKKVSAP